MLYVTTRNQIDVFTPEHPLRNRRDPDGGLYCPFHALRFSPEEIEGLKDVSFNQCMADMLKTMFGISLSSWEVDFCIGRYPVRLKNLESRLSVCEPWHNTGKDFRNMVEQLSKRMNGQHDQGWVEMAVRIAVLFGLYGELRREGILNRGEVFDLAVLSGSFMEPMSAWYAKQWGLPVGKIVCCCNENNTVWNLICQGQFPTDQTAVSTCVPGADIVLPEELERLVAACGDTWEMEHFLGCCETGKTYCPEEPVLNKMREHLYVSVVGSERIRQTVAGVYKASSYLLSPESALVYSGLQYYRAGKEQLRKAVVMTNRSPALDLAFAAEALGIPEETLRQQF